MQKKIERNFFVFEIILSELVVLNCLCQQIMLMIDCHSVKKQSEDFVYY